MTTPPLDHGPVCTAENLERIAELTEDGLSAREIATTLGIGVRSVQKGRQIMGVFGYNPTAPGQEVDEIAVLRATWGEPVDVNFDERRLAIAALLDAGKSHSQIARTLRISSRTVQRHANKLRAA